jgi:phage repressor protein C with HTH and peptisase S24 domain
VLVNSDELTPKSGQIYLVSWFDEARIKRIFREGNHCYRLSSDNTNKTVYPDERVDLSTTHDVSILGRVVWQAGTL